MSKFHINPETGEPGRCHAQKQCRFTQDPHFATEQESREYYEKTQDELFAKIETTDLVNSMELKEMDAALLATTLFKESQQYGLDANYIASSIDIASILHARQMRTVRAGFPKTPYIEHPLRNAIRLIRLGNRDNDLIVASVLHDTLEDTADVFVEKYLKKTPTTEEKNRRKLAAFIKARYGENTLKIVQAVTNPLDTEEDPTLSKHENYRKHVVSQISSNPDAYLVKISDFFDNAGSLYHQDKPGNERMIKRLSSKYYPLIKDFQEYAPTVKERVSESGYREILTTLETLDSRLSELQNKYKNYGT